MLSRPRPWRTAILFVLLSLGLTGTALGLERVALQLKWHHQFQFAGYYAAKTLGYYEQAGLDVEIRPVDLDRDPLQEVLRGNAQFGVASTDLLLQRNSGKPVVALATIFQHSPYVLLAMRRNGIETVHDLVGRKVLIDPFATEVVAYLRTMGVPLERIELIEANNYTFEDLLSGRADAYAGYSTNDPFYLSRAGATFMSFLPRSAGIDFYGDNLFTVEEQLERFPDRVAAFREASLRGWKYAVDHPEQVIDLMIRHGWGKEEDRTKLRFEAEKIGQIIRADLVEIGYNHEARWRHIVETYADLGMLPRDMSLDGFLYGRRSPLLPVWAFWGLGIFSSLALLSAGFSLYVHRAKKRLESQIAQREKAENAELKLAGAVYQSLGDALMVTDQQAGIVSVNPALSRMTGFDAKELIGRRSELLFETSQREDVASRIRQGLEQAGQWSGPVSIARRAGGPMRSHLFVRAIKDDAGESIRNFCIFSPLEADKSKDDTIWNSLHLDPVTGLPNRRLFVQELREATERQRSDAVAPVTVMMIDIDRFKEVNDALGHHMGDMVLVETARRLRGCVTAEASIARFESDKFAIRLVDGSIPERAVETIVQRVLAAMAEPFNAPQLPFHLSASIGIAQFPKDSDSAERLLQLAEQAMFFAKESGRNRRVYFSASMQEAATERARLTNDLRNALEFGELHLEYQPIVELATGRIAKAEALLRWQHPVDGSISPSRFIPLAERSGLIVPIGRWAFREACRQLVQWRREHDLQLSVNRSPLELQQDATDSEEAAFIRAIGLPGSAIAVEITEGRLLDTAGVVGERLGRIRAAGMQIALDDFGTGYSSLAYLQKMDVTYIKIDRAFVRDLESNASNRTLCLAMIRMAQGLGIEVIAEGVESAAQATILSELGCRFGQGFHFSVPLSAQAFEALLRRPDALPARD
jgi:diguanylate cyclase (GGDEF)-like protein/PAS domain S-box-containing protein